jgi:hypothetical protein
MYNKFNGRSRKYDAKMPFSLLRNSVAVRMHATFQHSTEQVTRAAERAGDLYEPHLLLSVLWAWR